MSVNKIPLHQRDYIFKKYVVKYLFENDELFKGDFSDNELDNIIPMYDIPEFKELNYTIEDIREIFRKGIYESMCLLHKLIDDDGNLIDLVYLPPSEYLAGVVINNEGEFIRSWETVNGTIEYLENEVITISLSFKFDYIISKYEKLVTNGKRPDMDDKYVKILQREDKLKELI